MADKKTCGADMDDQGQSSSTCLSRGCEPQEPKGLKSFMILRCWNSNLQQKMKFFCVVLLVPRFQAPAGKPFSSIFSQRTAAAKATNL